MHAQLVVIVSLAAAVASGQTLVDVTASWPVSSDARTAGYKLYWQKTGLTAPQPNPDLRLAVISSSQNSSGSYTGDVYRLGCASGGFFGSVDEGVMGYSACEGDFTFTAKLTRLDNTDPKARAGVMVRAQLFSNGTYAAALISPANLVVLRTNQDSLASRSGLSTGSCWFRVSRRGDTLSMETGSDGATYALLGKVAWQGSNAYVGVAQTSGTFSATGTADFTAVSLLTALGPVSSTSVFGGATAGTTITGQVATGCRYRFYLMTLNEYHAETAYLDTVQLDLTAPGVGASVPLAFGRTAVRSGGRMVARPRLPRFAAGALVNLAGRLERPVRRVVVRGRELPVAQ